VHTILVTFALRQEGASFERRLIQRIPKSGSVFGRLDSQEVAVSWLGIGARNEERFKSTLTGFHPDLVINSGFAGAVRTLLEPGDFVLAENYSSAELLKRLDKRCVFAARGRFACVDTVADSAAKMRFNAEGSILAVEMESAPVAEICRKLSVPLLSAKMISDRHDEEIPKVFLGEGIRQKKELLKAIAFASRMIMLRRNLADRVVELIRAISLTGQLEATREAPAPAEHLPEPTEGQEI
jgi:nucleoside phosphorylase